MALPVGLAPPLTLAGASGKQENGKEKIALSFPSYYLMVSFPLLFLVEVHPVLPFSDLNK